MQFPIYLQWQQISQKNYQKQTEEDVQQVKNDVFVTFAMTQIKFKKIQFLASYFTCGNKIFLAFVQKLFDKEIKNVISIIQLQTNFIMGSTNSQTSSSASIISTKKTFNDPRYGGMFHISVQTATAYQQIILEERNLAGLIQLANKRKNMQHPNLLTVTHYLVKDKKRNGLSDLFACQGEAPCELYLQYPYLTRTLEDVIQEHSQENKMIPEKDIVRIFRAVVDVLDFLKKNNTCHGDVKAGSILFDHLGNPKLIDSYFIHGGKTAYEIVLENPSSMSLLSPEQLENIKFRKFEDLSTIHMSQMFAVGLTMIEAMTFEAAMQCYNLNSLEIINDFYERKEKEIYSIGYSHRLCQLVLACLQEEPKQRPAFTDFLKIIDQL